MRILPYSSALLLYAAAVFAQDAKAPAAEPPPEVDAALRSRISQFYQAHVDGKYRIADQVVAEDSKDVFFAAAKPRYLGFEIIRINYSANFTKAEAVVSCQADWYLQGHKTKVNLPGTSLWKVEDGQWFWYVLPVKDVKSPFGTLHYNNVESTDSQAPAPPIPGDPQVLAHNILQSVRTDKTQVTLRGYEHSSAEVKIINGMQGPISISADINGRFPGLTFSLDKKDLKAGESATLTFVCDPKDRVAKPTLTATISVEPINQVIPITLLFAIPPEIEKLIPKEARPKPPQP